MSVIEVPEEQFLFVEILTDVGKDTFRLWISRKHILSVPTLAPVGSFHSSEIHVETLCNIGLQKNTEWGIILLKVEEYFKFIWALKQWSDYYIPRHTELDILKRVTEQLRSVVLHGNGEQKEKAGKHFVHTANIINYFRDFSQCVTSCCLQSDNRFSAD